MVIHWLVSSIYGWERLLVYFPQSVAHPIHMWKGVCAHSWQSGLFFYYVWVHEYSVCLYSVVLPDESGVSGQQTRPVRGSVNPVFNHTMVYDGFQSSDLIQACAEITVWNLHPSSCLGGVRLSTGSGNTDLNILQ